MTILFYPDNLKPNCKLFLALKDLGINFHSDINKEYDLAFFWSYKSCFTPQDNFVKNNIFLNKGCYDVSKTRVSDIYDNLIVDPTNYNGSVVRKTENQCSKDDTLVTCPTKKENGFIYRKYIDTYENNFHIVYRLFYMGGPSILTKKYFKDLGKTFVKWEEVPLSIISEKKIQKIILNSNEFGVDFAEIDLLKDKDGNFYVIDINNVAGYSNLWTNKNNINLYEKYKKEVNVFLNKKINSI